MSGFTTSGMVTMDAKQPISSKNGPDDQSPLVASLIYRLNGLICHYGYTHSFGHFVAYRRKPEPKVQSHADSVLYPRGRWLRISDADVSEVPESAVLGERSNAFLLFYERLANDASETSVDASVLPGDSRDADLSGKVNVLDALKRQQDVSVPPPTDDIPNQTTQKSVDSLD